MPPARGVAGSVWSTRAVPIDAWREIFSFVTRIVDRWPSRPPPPSSSSTVCMMESRSMWRRRFSFVRRRICCPRSGRGGGIACSSARACARSRSGAQNTGFEDPGERATARRRASISRLRATFSPSSSATRDAAAASGLPRRHVTLRARSGDPPDDGLRFGGRSGTRRRGECGAPVRCEVRRKKDAASCTGLPAPGGDRKGRAGDAACGDACACAPCCGDACCRDPKKFDMARGSRGRTPRPRGPWLR